MAEALAAPNPRPADRQPSARSRLKSTFFTADDLSRPALTLPSPSVSPDFPHSLPSPSPTSVKLNFTVSHSIRERKPCAPEREGVMSYVELDGVLIVIFLKITDAPLRVMIVSFHGCEGTGKGAVLCQDCSSATRAVPTSGGPVHLPYLWVHPDEEGGAPPGSRPAGFLFGAIVISRFA